MTDDERIARLTQLARQVWDHEEDHPVTVQRGLRGCDPATAFVRTGNGIVLDVAAPNDRALDMLEAALVVGAAEDRVPLTERRLYEDRIASLERDRDALLRRYRELQARADVPEPTELSRQVSRQCLRAEQRAEAAEAKLAEVRAWMREDPSPLDAEAYIALKAILDGES